MSSSGSRFKRILPFRHRSRSGEGPSTLAPAAGSGDLDPFPHGLKTVAEGENPLVDIVAVHGLDGHRDRTWTAENQVNWLRDLLPHDIPHARIFCWGYDANTRDSDRVSCHYLYDHARTLISELCQERKHSDSAERPIIFVAYSMGGIVVKSALIHSDATRPGALEEHRSIKVSTYGIIFLGTPHQGANGIQLGKLLVNIASLFVAAADDRILKHLERDSEWLQQQLGQYGLISDQFMTKFAYEEYSTRTALGQSLMVVPRASAVVPGQANAEPVAIHTNHLNMVKYKSREDSGYKTISRHLKDMTNDAVEQIQRRWQAEKRSNEVYLNASSVTFNIDFSLFRVPEVTHFVAREEELAQLHEILGKGPDRRTAVIHGLGGMGKTQLAVAYAKRHRCDYSAVFWTNARDEVSLKQGFLWMAERILSAYPSLVYIKRAVESQDLDEAIRAVKRWFDSPENNNWLIIYDNYDNPIPGGKEADADGRSAFEGYDIRPFFPSVHQGAILITTRSSRVELGHRVPLKKLKTIEHGLEILSHTSQRQDLHDDSAANELARELDGLPLAISTAGAYLHNMPTTCAEYLQLYKESWRRLHITTPSLVSYDRALHSTWDISYAQVKQQNAASAMLLQLWAYFDHEDLWLELLQAGRLRGPPWFQEITDDSIDFNKAVRVLCDFGLAEPSVLPTEYIESPGYGIHSCVHAWTINVLNEPISNDLARLAMICMCSKVPKNTERKYYITQRRLLQHASFCLIMILNRVLVIEGDEWMLEILGNLFRDQSRLPEAEALCERALKGREKALGPDHTKTLRTMNNLGLVYWNQGRLPEAEAIFKRALEGREKALGPDHTETLRTMNNLGIVYGNQGRLPEAEAIYKRVLEGKEKALGPDHTETLRTMNNLGIVYRNQGRLPEAEAIFKRALEGQEKALGPDHTETLRTMNNLGVVYWNQGRLPEAEAMYKRTLQGYENTIIHKKFTISIDFLEHLEDFAKFQVQQGKTCEAISLYVRCQAGLKAVFGIEHSRYEAVAQELESLSEGGGN